MNEEAIKDAYKLFKAGGYNGSQQDFLGLISTNSDARKDAFNLFSSAGYSGGEAGFSGLLGLSSFNKKKEESALPLDQGSTLSATPGTEPQKPSAFSQFQEKDKEYVPFAGVQPVESRAKSKEFQKAEKEKAIKESKKGIFKDVAVNPGDLVVVQDKGISKVTRDYEPLKAKADQLQEKYGDLGFKFEANKNYYQGEDIFVTSDDGTSISINTSSINENNSEDANKLQEFLFSKSAGQKKRELTPEELLIYSKRDDYQNISKAKYDRIYTDENIKKSLEFTSKKISAELSGLKESKKELYELEAKIQGMGDSAPQESLDDYASKLKMINSKVEDIKASSNIADIAIKNIIAERNDREKDKGSAGWAMYNSLVSGVESLTKGVVDVLVESSDMLSMGAMDKEKKGDQVKIIQELISSDFDYIKARNVTEEYLRSQNLAMTALFGVGETLPALLVPGGALARVSAMTVQGIGRRMDEYDNSPEMKAMASREEMFLISALKSVVEAKLENVGITQAFSKSGLANSLVIKALQKWSPKMGNKALNGLVNMEINNLAAKAALNTAGAFIAEAETGALQNMMETSINELYNVAKEKKVFDQPKVFTKDWIEGVGKDALMEGLGGVWMGGAVNVARYTAEGVLGAKLNNEEFELVREMLSDGFTAEAMMVDLKNKVINGKMTVKEMSQTVANFKKAATIVDQMPDGELSLGQQRVAFDLINERTKLEGEIAGKDPNLVSKKKNRINEINERLKFVSENAVQEQTKSEAPVQPETAVVEEVAAEEQIDLFKLGDTEYELGDDGKWYNAETLEEIDEETTGRVKSEAKPSKKIPKRGSKGTIAGVKVTYPTMQEARERKAARNESKYVEESSENLEEENTEVLAEELQGEFGILTAENPMAQPLTEEENRQLNEKAEEFLKEKGYKPRRVTGKYGQAENSFFVKGLTKEDAIAFAKKFNQDSVAHSEGLVYQDGAMNPRVKSEDNFTFKDFTPESNFVSVIKTKDGLKTFEIGYDFDTKTTPTTAETGQQQTLAAEQGTPTTIEGTGLRENIKKSIAKVFKKFEVKSFKNAKEMAAYAKATYNQETGANDAARVFVGENGVEVLVNDELSDDTALGHEVWHALLLKAFGDNQQQFAEFRGAINKTLRENGYEDIADSLDEFSSQYTEEGEVPAEEYLAQLGGMMTSAKIDLKNLDKAQRTLLEQIKDIINEFAVKLTGQPVFLKDATAETILDFMSTMSDMMAKGEDISGFFVSPTKLDNKGNLPKPSSRAQKSLKDKNKQIEKNTKAKVQKGDNVSTRVPSRGNPHSNSDLIVSTKVIIDAAKTDKGAKDYALKLAKTLAQYPNVNINKDSIKTLEDAQNVFEKFKENAKSNLKWLYDQFSDEVRTITKLWYDGANIVSNEIAKEYGYTTNQVSGVMAVLSPQMDWFRNLSLGKRVIDIYNTKKESTIDDKMEEYIRNANTGTGEKASPLFEGPAKKLTEKSIDLLIKEMKGKKFKDMSIPEKAFFVRAYDEVYSTRDYENISPTGDINGFVMTEKGARAKVGWGGFGPIMKAISILEDGNVENISKNLGNQHKVRNFFVNISNPNDVNAVTIDTHAVAAALLKPLAGSDAEVNTNLSGPPKSASTGLVGSYPVLADAYRELAKELGILPRELQSITWEAVRGLYKASFKTAKNKKAINEIWERYRNGEITINQLYEEVNTKAGGVSKPVWYEYVAEGDIKVNEENSAAIDQGKLSDDYRGERPESDTTGPEVKTRAQKTVPAVVDEVLTDDGKGNYVFVHYSDERRKTIKPMSGSNKGFTSREEVSAISSVGGVAMYYTKQGQVEQGVGDVPHTVLVPKDKVYFYGTTEMGKVRHDIENFDPEARRRFQEYKNRNNPGRPTEFAFDSDNSAAWVGKVAEENGYDMLVTNWGGPMSYRAQSVKELTPEADYTAFKEIPEPVFEVGDEVFLYGRYSIITGVEPDVLTYKSENALGSVEGKFPNPMNVKSQYKILMIKKAKPTTATRAQKAQPQTIPGYDRMISQVNGIITKSKNRGLDKVKTTENVLNYIQKSAVYERADDLQREQIVRDAIKLIGLPQKSAPRVDRVLGIKDKVSAEDKKNLMEVIKAQVKATKNLVKVQKEISKQINKEIRELKEKGKITTSQMIAALRRLSEVDLLNEESVSNFLDYVARVFKDAAYYERVTNINRKRRAAKDSATTKIGIADGLTPLLQKIFSIDARTIPEKALDAYEELVNMFADRSRVLQLSDIENVTKMAQKVFDAVEGDVERARSLAEVLSNYENMVTDEDGNIQFSKTVDQMINDGSISAEDGELMKKYKSMILEEAGLKKEKDVRSEEEIEEERQQLVETVKNYSPVFFQLPTQDERNVAREIFRLIQTGAIDKMSNKDLKDLLRIIDNIERGFLPHSAQIMKERMNQINNGETLSEAVNKAKMLPIESRYAKIKALFGGSAIRKAIDRNPLFFIDELFGNFNTRPVFESIFRPISRAFSLYQSEVNTINRKIQNAMDELSNSLGKNPNKMQLAKQKVMAYMLESEYQANPNSKEVRSAKDFLDATIKYAEETEQNSYSDKDIENLKKIRDEFFSGETVDLGAMLESFSPAEKKAIKTISDINNELSSKVAFTSAIIRGRKVGALNNYIHHNTLGERSAADMATNVSMADVFNASMRPSTKAKSLIERTGAATPLVFDPFSSTTRGARQLLMDYHLTEPIRTARRTVKYAESKVTGKQKRILNAISGGLEQALSNTLINTYHETTFVEDAIRYMEQTGYRNMLGSIPRAVAELTSNLSYVMLYDPKSFISGVSKYGSVAMSETGLNIMKNVRSQQIERLYPASKLSGRLLDREVMSQASGIKAGKSRNDVVNAMTIIYNYSGKQVKNVAESTADALIGSPDKAVMKPLWFGAFAAEFKKATGQEVDYDKIANNNEAYLTEFSEAIDQASGYADETSIRVGSSDNPFTGILKGANAANQSAMKQAFNKFNNFMTRFLITEYSTARTGVYALMGDGKLTRKQGAEILGATMSRMIVYSLLSKELVSIMMGMLGFGDDEEDEKTFFQKLGQATASAFSGLILGRNFGNFTKAPINIGVEEMNKELLDFLREGDYDPYEDAIQYTIIPKDERKQGDIMEYVKSFSGAFAPMISTAQRTLEVVVKEPKTQAAQERRLRELSTRIPLEIIGNTGHIPLYRDTRKLVMESLYEDMRNEKKGSGGGGIKTTISTKIK